MQGEVWKSRVRTKGACRAGTTGEGHSMGTATAVWRWGRRSLLVTPRCEMV